MHEAEENCNVQPYQANTDTSRVYQDLNFPQRFECPCKFRFSFSIYCKFRFFFLRVL